jgi:DNA-binding CsgD family transcriptional regulator
MTGLTENDKRTLAKLANGDLTPRDLESGIRDDEPPAGRSGPYAVNEQTCENIREYLHNHSYREAADFFGLNFTTVKYHSTTWSLRSCSHSGNSLDSERCAVARIMSSDGHPCTKIANKFDVSRRTVSYHVFGDCTHEHAVAPRTEPRQRKVTDTMCRAFQRSSKTNQDLANQYDLARSTVSRHAAGNCGCE